MELVGFGREHLPNRVFCFGNCSVACPLEIDLGGLRRPSALGTTVFPAHL